MSRKIKAVDLFCGAGGSSTGLAQACEELGLELSLLAINHWNVAIDTHSANHPGVEHLCEDLISVDPRKAVPGGKLDILIASPECTHHSIARGGKPINDQSRASAWHVLRWCEALRIENVLIENVKEFQTWGPIGTNGRPLKRRKGEIFFAFITAVRSLGYEIDWKVLNAADYGDPTSRERLFIIARRGRKSIAWPEPTHAPVASFKKKAQRTLFDSPSRQPHRSAREIIDWSIQGESIFNRKRPLSPNTLARIFAGLRKYSGLPFITPNFGEREGQEPRTHAIDNALPVVTSRGAGNLVEPFIVGFRQNPHHRSIEEPLSTVATSGAHHGLCQPFIVRFNNGQDAESVDSPLSCVMTKDHHALCEPFIVVNRNNNRPRSVDEPLACLCTGNHMYLIEPFVLGQQSKAAPRDVEQPLPTIATDGAISLVQPFLIGAGGPQGSSAARSVDEPMRTVLAVNHQGIVGPFLVAVSHGQDANYSRRVRSLDDPVPSLTTSNSLGCVQPYLVKYNGTGLGAHSIDEPLDTISTKDRFGLCIPQLGAVLDIRFRMLQPHELAAAMSFPKTYVFKGNREQRVKQIGNAVCVRMAKALCKSLLTADNRVPGSTAAVNVTAGKNRVTAAASVDNVTRSAR